MIKKTLLAAAVLLTAAPALAQAPAAAPPAPPPPRARGPALNLAVEMAMAAIANCASTNYNTTALVTDSAGVTVAMLSSEKAAARTQMIAGTKIAIVMKYKVPSLDIVERVKTDAALDAAIKADPAIGAARGGAIPIMVGGTMIGAIAVSGAPGGDKDAVCSQAGIDKVQSRLM